jgi:hypothetical protein
MMTWPRFALVKEPEYVCHRTDVADFQDQSSY